MDSNVVKNAGEEDSPSGKGTSKERKRGRKIIPKDAKLVPNIPEEDYFSDVSGVYYHFNKMEWRTICKDPFKISKRWQRTFGIKRYGFYEAKKKAEVKAFETTKNNQITKILSRYSQGVTFGDPNNETRYYTPGATANPLSLTCNFSPMELFNYSYYPGANYEIGELKGLMAQKAGKEMGRFNGDKMLQFNGQKNSFYDLGQYPYGLVMMNEPQGHGNLKPYVK